MREGGIIIENFYYRCKERFFDALPQIVQLLLFFIFPVFIYNMHVANMLESRDKINIEVSDILAFFIVEYGDYASVILAVISVIRLFHWLNKNKMLNIGNRYHDHSMIYYRLCATLLGYKKCSLVRVPIDKQFCLVVNDCFEEYDDGGDLAYSTNEDVNIKIEILDSINCNMVINLCIEDTYPIKNEYIPTELRLNKTIKISRYDDNQLGIRCYSRKFVDKVTSVIKQLPEGKYSVNIMATTNVRHTMRIAQDIFKTGGRGNIEHLFVYRQLHGHENRWEFSSPTKVF